MGTVTFQGVEYIVTSGRLGLPPPQGFRQSLGFLMLSAPNRYRKMPVDQTAERQRAEYPEVCGEPLGIDLDPTTWDEVLIWKL
jgi:hypothetical protein